MFTYPLQQRFNICIITVQVSSSFENLVGGLLAVPPRAHCRRPLANVSETLAVRTSTVPAPTADDGALAGHGADFPALMAAFLSTPAVCGGVRLSADPVVDPSTEPVLPLSSKQAPPQHVRRAKLLFKSCRSCVQRRRRSDDVTMT